MSVRQFQMHGGKEPIDKQMIVWCSVGERRAIDRNARMHYLNNRSAFLRDYGTHPKCPGCGYIRRPGDKWKKQEIAPRRRAAGAR